MKICSKVLLNIMNCFNQDVDFFEAFRLTLVKKKIVRTKSAKPERLFVEKSLVVIGRREGPTSERN